MSRLDLLRTRPEATVLIVGGGINGAGLFRDLALQGVDVLLIDGRDFCAGASAASSRMIHGGLRYLENGEFRLVRESLYERNLLLANAAHVVYPLPTCIPIFNRLGGLFNGARTFLRLGGKPGRRGALLIAIGLTLYDAFSSRQRRMPTHSFASRDEALTQRPALNPGITCTATYYDAWITYPERLCLELILDAQAANPQAQAFNYLALESASGDSVTLRDKLSGETLTLRPQIVVNASGAWIDQTNQAAGRPTSLIGGTKGSHLILDNPQLRQACQNQQLWYENDDGRICIVFPFHDKVLLGSTDIHVDDPETARCDDDEIAYMLAAVQHILPGIAVDRSQIVASFCGVRPLPRSNAATPGQVSRDHSSPRLAPDGKLNFPIYALIGGKWTTFRAFAAQVADAILAELGRARLRSTDDLPIGGGRDYPATSAARRAFLAGLKAATGLERGRLEELFERYGTRAAQIAAFMAEQPDAVLGASGYSRGEIAFLIAHEHVARLDDLVLRRTSLALLGKLDAALLATLAELLAAARGWTPTQTQAEIERTVELLAREHHVTLRA